MADDIEVTTQEPGREEVLTTKRALVVIKWVCRVGALACLFWLGRYVTSSWAALPVLGAGVLWFFEDMAMADLKNGAYYGGTTPWMRISEERRVRVKRHG